MSDLSNEVKDVFQPRSELLKLRREAVQVFNEAERATYQKIAKRFAEERGQTTRSFEADYASKVSEAQKRLIDKAGSVKRGLVPKWGGADNFDKTHTNRRAQQEVRATHENELKRIDQSESEVLAEMLTKARERMKPSKNFQSAVDGRSVLERRPRSWSR